MITADHQIAHDFSGGRFYWSRGTHYFVRLWPDPVVLKEVRPEIWTELTEISDDFSHTLLRQFKREAIERYASTYPDFVTAICHDPEGVDATAVPAKLAFLLHVEKPIRQRDTFLTEIPSPVLQTIQRYGSEHYTLLRYVFRHPGILELMDASPVLGFMVATHTSWKPRNQTATDAELDRMPYLRRRDILKWLNFPSPSESLARVISRITPHACKKDLLQNLRVVCRKSEVVRRLSFLAPINEEVLDSATNPDLSVLATNALLAEIAEMPPKEAAKTGKLIRVCRLILDDPDEDPNPRVFSTVAQARVFYTNNAAFWCFNEVMEQDILFPPPPFPDHEYIQALQTPEDVVQEGKTQRNCVGMLLSDIAAGRMYLYRVLHPERATVSVLRKDGQWKLDEVEGTQNKSVGEDTRALVKKWFAESPSATT